MVLKNVPREELEGKKKSSESGRKIFIESENNWNELLANFKSQKVPKQLIDLFSTTRRNQQEALLKGLILTPDILMAYIIKAFEKYGFTLSQFSSEYSQKGLDISKMPLGFEVKDDGTVEKFGETELSDGQLKQALEHRKVKIGKFLEKEDEWHCFFTTYKSLRGEETWLGAKQPHFHYISNLFGIERHAVINQIKEEKYSLGSLPHIKLEEYGNQPNEK